MKKQENLETILESGVIAVIRGTEVDKMVKIVEALQEGGIKALEVTLNTPGALDMIKELAVKLEDTDVVVGAGTVLDGETARAAILAGAEFVFAPNLNYDVIEVCNRYGKIVIPGVMTPTEIVNAYQAGADLVKVFPAKVVGPGFIKSVKGPLDHIPMMPTGGVNLDNAADFIEAGSVALGVGGSLLDQEAIDNEDYEVLTEKAKQFVQVVEETRESLA
ncbi:bifunctional 2-keto-4-hydroxyglutarate aldolase/2-keto-3-deoxy-6-phosphogluconate aldolase [Natroniella sulfidigena]|uniref:bifunctional 4-hydroxy-2-oxoglutarate aldolase/2-dehydro-3-deoxy-phosphogluconate aldolase n=1 Tax=Natroniella sulfidigena TaxID=723921 RepID=UPI00200AEB3A|nr:bifunctional 2-keto-4-hydroxyglutarate aldolase/2-keto-3-deoxy-6-phosphogluconate aldolase [Natroniella sulfidigena]MCK8816725.1 bifunctional 2-keto-4-hydroxyglutarate aldolase/2-keto-3-deoxy-6-phosphogluconate aldolase [Natroniella sulfidigena]